VALAQLNLKLPPEVLAQWRAQAAAEGLSVRDWLLATLAPAAEPQAGPAGLLERLQALEATLAELAGTVAQLQQTRPPRSPRPAPAAPPAAPLPIPADLPADGIESAALAQLLGVKRGTFNARIARAGGPREGLELEGWRCLCLRTPARGGPPRALWVPVAT
jgi:hypothetical protein